MRKIVLLIFCVSNITCNVVDIRTINSNIRTEHRYATEKNFSGKQLYSYNTLPVHRDAAHALDLVQKDLEKQGLGLLIWDAYRSSQDQQKLWDEACRLGGEATNHVSNPATSPGYKNRGTHVELTLVDANGKQLEMPTDFDELVAEAATDYMDLPEQVIKNRAVLHAVMTKHGFKNYPKEWWYFWLDDPNGKPLEKYPPIELTEAEINSLSK